HPKGLRRLFAPRSRYRPGFQERGAALAPGASPRWRGAARQTPPPCLRPAAARRAAAERGKAPGRAVRASPPPRRDSVSVKCTTDFCSTLPSEGTVAGYGITVKHSCLAIRINYNPGIRTVNALELPRWELAVCQSLHEDVPSRQDSLGAAGNTQKRRRRLDRNMIGEPMNFVHTAHVGAREMSSDYSSAVSIQDHMKSKGGYTNGTSATVEI
ncbi:uncharacterized protein M6G45_010471, partial [Spheniscus humboldti]